MSRYYIRTALDGSIIQCSEYNTYSNTFIDTDIVNFFETYQEYRFVNNELKLINPWHYHDKPYRMFISKDANIQLSETFPELSMWRKLKNLPTFQTDNGMYVYMAELLDVSIGNFSMTFEQLKELLIKQYGVEFSEKPV